MTSELPTDIRLQNKKQISLFASKAKNLMLENSFYAQLIEKKRKQINQNKQFLDNIIQIKSVLELANYIKETLKEINSKINNENLELIKNNQKLKEKKMCLRYKIYSSTDLTNEYSSAQEDQFILENAIKEKDSQLHKINTDLGYFSKYVLFKEPRRDIYVEDTSSVIPIFYAQNEAIQDLLISRAKGFNKLENKIKNNNILLQTLKNPKRKRSYDLNNKELNYRKGRLKSTEAFDTKYNINLNCEDEDEDEIGSDSDDIDFDNKITQKKYLKDINFSKEIPKIDLKQIEYNKRKVKKGEEASEISLSRRDDDELDSQIKTLRQKIRLSKNKVKNKENKMRRYLARIEKMEELLRESGLRFTKENIIGNSSMTYRKRISPIKEEL